MRGRPPNPLRIITKSGHRPIRAPARLAPGIPSRPSHITGAGRRLWQELTDLLAPSGVVERIDATALEMLCAAYQRKRYAEKKIKTAPEVAGSKGQPVISPWFGVLKDAEQTMKGILTEFGLTPAARVRIGTKKPAASSVSSDIRKLLA